MNVIAWTVGTYSLLSVADQLYRRVANLHNLYVKKEWFALEIAAQLLNDNIC